MRSGDVEKSVGPPGGVSEQLRVEANRGLRLLTDTNCNSLENEIVCIMRAGLFAIDRVTQRGTVIHFISPALSSAGPGRFRWCGFVSNFLREERRDEKQPHRKHRRCPENPARFVTPNFINTSL